MASDKIIIQDLELSCRIGVPEAERAQPQRLLVSLEMEHDFAPAAAGDDLNRTINYDAVCRQIRDFAARGSWKLLERFSEEIAQLVLKEFRPSSVVVEIKKFIIPETKYVAVRIERRREGRSRA